jgi:hypothetical protein
VTFRTHYLAAAAAIGALAVPAAAQTAYPGYQPPQCQQPVPQPYPGQPGYGYQQGYSAYGQQGYAQNPVAQIIDSLLGNRYNVTDRTAVSQCASAAMAQATAQYGGGYNSGYANGYNRGYSNLRVTSISDVQRRNNGLRVSGLMSSGYGGQYGSQYGSQDGYQYGNQYAGYGQQLSFRCNVDYRGAVTNIRIRQSNNYRR